MRGGRSGWAVTGATGGDERGFTLVALLLVLVALSIALALAQPFLHRNRLEARAARVVEELNLVRSAVLTFRDEQGSWPEDSRRGQLPAVLEGYLPSGFSFQTPYYTFDLENWGQGGSQVFEEGISFFTDDPELGITVLEMLGTGVWTDGQTKYSWVIQD